MVSSPFNFADLFRGPLDVVPVAALMATPTRLTVSAMSANPKVARVFFEADGNVELDVVPGRVELHADPLTSA